MKIPFLDLKKQYESIKNEIDAAIHDVLDTTQFIGGKHVRDFNVNFANFIGAKHALGVGNGTDAIVIALRSLELDKDSEVIVPANSFIATSEAVTTAGYQVIFADCLQDYYTIDPDKIEEQITDRTKAIIPVHLYGQPAHMDEISAIAKKYGLFVIEDCAQAHGATYKGKNVGTLGDIGTFSFYPGKNLGAYGDGGAITTNNDTLYKKCAMYANHGRIEKYNHEFEGINSRLDSMQAAVLNVKMTYMDKWNDARRRVADWYNEYLSDCPGIDLPKVAQGVLPVYHLFVIRSKNRNELKDYLKEHGIDTGIHYPIGLPFLKAYDHMNLNPDDFKVTYNNQDELLSLPIYPELSEEQIKYISHTIKTFCNS